MAEFKRALGSSGEGSGDGFAVDGTTVAALGDLAGSFWPLLVGGVIVIMLMLRGEERAVIPVGGMVLLLQAWQSGLLQ